MTGLGDQDARARFVARARRTEPHSLVRAWDVLVHHAQGSFTGHLDDSRTASRTRGLPEDEEAVGFLAARGSDRLLLLVVLR
jgi:hypothetical protein